MSNLSDKTEYRALVVIAQIVMQFEKLRHLKMTKEDDWDATHAKNLLKGIVESDGYKVNDSTDNKNPILKSKS